MLIVGYGYKARQGKNTAALAALESCPLETQVRMYAFGDALKMEVRKACLQFGGQHELIAAWKTAGVMPEWVQPEDPKPRSLLQWWGTDYRRAKDPAYWIKRLKHELDAQIPEIALITDVRFPNECAAIKAWGGYVVHCVRLGEPDVQVHEHASECALDGYKHWDHTLYADSIPALQTASVGLLKKIARKHDLSGS